MTTQIKKETLIKDSSLHLKELASAEMKDSLDPTGWIIKHTGQMAEPDGEFISLEDSSGECVAGAVIAPAELSEFQRITGAEINKLTKSLYLSSLWLSPNANVSNVLPMILYLALRRGRIYGREDVVTLLEVPNTDIPIATLLHLERLAGASEFEKDEKKYLPLGQRVKYSLHKLYEECDAEQAAFLRGFFVPEILETHQAWLDRFYHGPWAQSVVNATMSRQQYVHSLYNLHEYVRYTTRLCARCIAHSDGLDLRNHYIYHLKGEINHELIIERDLKHLGADLEYLHSGHVPHCATREFMMAQESAIGFYQDPVLMLACPLTAEGVAAHMSEKFVSSLHSMIASWGVDDPKEAARFLTSHIHTDGGDDGHFKHVIDILEKNINDEGYHQKFLGLLGNAMTGFENGFNANIIDMQVWSQDIGVKIDE